MVLLIVKAADMHILSNTMAAVQQLEKRRKNIPTRIVIVAFAHPWGGRSCPLLALPAVSRLVPMLVGVAAPHGFNAMGHRRYWRWAAWGVALRVLGHSRVRGPRAGGRRPPPTATPARERLAIGDYSQGSRRQQRAEGAREAAWPGDGSEERSCWWTSRGGRSRRACARRPLRGGRSRHSGQLRPPPASGWPGPERPGPPRLRRDVSLVAGARAAARSTDEPKKVPEVSGLQRNGYRPNWSAIDRPPLQVRQIERPVT